MRTRAAISLTLILLLLPCLLQAQIYKVRHFAVGGGGSFAPATANVESGSGGQLYFSAEVKSQLSLRLSAGGYRSDVQPSPLSDGDYSLTFADIGLQLSGNHSVLLPYAGGGIGYCRTEHNLSDMAIEFARIDGKTIEETIDNYLCFHLYGGVDYPIYKSIHARTELKYIRFRPTATTTVTTIKTGDVEINEEKLDLDTIFVTVGIAIHF